MKRTSIAGNIILSPPPSPKVATGAIQTFGKRADSSPVSAARVSTRKVNGDFCFFPRSAAMPLLIQTRPTFSLFLCVAAAWGEEKFI